MKSIKHRKILRAATVNLSAKVAGGSSRRLSISLIASETRRMQALLIGSIFILSWGIYLILCRWLRVQEYLTISCYFEKKS